jgi:hypothetical protein
MNIVGIKILVDPRINTWRVLKTGTVQPEQIVYPVESIVVAMALRPIDNYYLHREEPVKSCLLFLRQFILAKDSNKSLSVYSKSP